MKKKTLLMTTSLLALTLAGCGGTNDAGTESTAGPEKVDGKYDPMVTITVGKQQDELAGKYKTGESLNDNVLTRWGEEELGIKIDTTLLGGDANNYNTKLRLALTGAEKLPDVVPVYDTQLLADLIESGQVKEVSEDMEQYMPERLKEIYDEFPNTFNPVTKDGKTYGFAIAPFLTESQVMLIRQDWLDNLGLEAPTNMEEFEQVLDAFTNDDPDQNGKKDTYGYTFSGKNGYNTSWVSDPVMIFSAYTGKYLPKLWVENEEGKLVYGSIQEGNKEALQTLRDWYEKGYINKEMAVLEPWDAMGDFTTGKAGIVLGRPWMYGTVSDLETNVEGAEIGAYPWIEGIKEDKTYQSGETNDGWFVFNKDFTNMEAFFDYYDKMYDISFGEGDFQYGIFEGYDYDMVDGKPTYNPKEFNEPMDEVINAGKMIFFKNAPKVNEINAFAKVYKGEEPENGIELKAASQKPTHIKGYAISAEQQDTLIPDAFNGVPTATMAKNGEQLNTLENEVFTKIIYGEKDIDAYDQFVQDWHEKGGDKITEEINEWYDSVK
ncbi:hypothetical protein LZ578_11725 [Jeotgalibaca sp. MA1X17-3]|uniref:hypothetical protein n=1 Tax=Jeotgalibaca sp. MA1X17-3 TaxID=2908211 RepID=UPI001F195A93|nr:hypothetical protein [Jeotgalibaca sp. MA1X17-3]UJF15607.1 hypothetical protein LZ578_11725 [Jeotgalibaca sp. MA1X17-3]